MRSTLRAFAIGALLAAAPALAQDAAALRARHAALGPQLAASAFQRPLHVDSSYEGGERSGRVTAVLEHPFGLVAPALRGVASWCDVLILHLNVKHCSSAPGGIADRLTLHVGPKYDQPLERAYRIDFAYRVEAEAADYLRVAFTAPAGPLGTTDYRFEMEVAPLEARRSFLYFSYAYEMGPAARLLVRSYLATLGRHKVGFSVVGRDADGRPEYVGGLRGLLERNTMRYYLAIEAYLDGFRAPPEERQETRLRGWHAATERYPAQLRELGREEYLAMKRRELARAR
jgi:hypothetical protein